jgi:hypothetical protein
MIYAQNSWLGSSSIRLETRVRIETLALISTYTTSLQSCIQERSTLDLRPQFAGQNR